MKVYDKFTTRYMINNVYGRNCYISPKKVNNKMPLPFANKTIRLKNYNGDRVATIIVNYYDYREDSNILNYIKLECAKINAINKEKCRDILLAVIRLRVSRIRSVMSKIIDWCDFDISYSGSVAIVYIDHCPINCLILLKPDEHEFFEYIETCNLNNLSNRPLVDSLICYLSRYVERMEYYEQEIAKSKN